MMKLLCVKKFWLGCGLAGLLLTGPAGQCAAETPPGEMLPVGADQALAALRPETPPLVLNAEIPLETIKKLAGASRGPAADVFQKVAPSTVIVRTGGGHGTGIVISEEGWILTNEHVIAPAAIDIGTGARWAYIHFGRMEDGVMVIEKQGHVAFVHAADSERDLAMLKLTTLPSGTKLVPLPFAEKNATPGSECVTVGHPARGLFWSVRSGEIVGTGQYPHDLIDNIMPQFVLADAAKESFARSLEQAGKRKVFLSTCGINPGDSGGPLVNGQGELVAVNFAIPKLDQEAGVNLDKFSYHVHLDEVKAFTADKPSQPEVFRPSQWPPAAYSQLLDPNNDNTFEVWMFAIHGEQPPSGFQFDLDLDTPSTFVEAFRQGNADRDQFDAEFAFVRLPQPRVFYDRDNDGEFDLIMTDIEGNDTSGLTIAKTDQGWVKQDRAGQQLFDPALFNDAKLQERFKQVLLDLQTAAEAPAEQPAAPPAAAPPVEADPPA